MRKKEEKEEEGGEGGGRRRRKEKSKGEHFVGYRLMGCTWGCTLLVRWVVRRLYA